MSRVRFGGRRTRRQAARDRFVLAPDEYAVVESPPQMWLPPLRPVLPENAPRGIHLGAFKPQREVERDFWPGPPFAVFHAEAEPVKEATQEPQGSPRWRRLTAMAAMLFSVAVTVAVLT